jgi:hypothetical protein
MSVLPPEVVAEREFHLADGRPFIVRWMKPIPVLMPHQDWLCLFEFIHPDGFTYRNSAYGVDGAQALFNALQGAAVNLYQQEAAIYWFEPNDDLGLPLHSSMDHIRSGRKEPSPVQEQLDRQDAKAAEQ